METSQRLQWNILCLTLLASIAVVGCGLQSAESTEQVEGMQTAESGEAPVTEWRETRVIFPGHAFAVEPNLACSGDNFLLWHTFILDQEDIVVFGEREYPKWLVTAAENQNVTLPSPEAHSADWEFPAESIIFNPGFRARSNTSDGRSYECVSADQGLFTAEWRTTQDTKSLQIEPSDGSWIGAKLTIIGYCESADTPRFSGRNSSQHECAPLQAPALTGTGPQ